MPRSRQANSLIGIKASIEKEVAPKPLTSVPTHSQDPCQPRASTIVNHLRLARMLRRKAEIS